MSTRYSLKNIFTLSFLMVATLTLLGCQSSNATGQDMRIDQELGLLGSTSKASVSSQENKALAEAYSQTTHTNKSHFQRSLNEPNLK